MSRYSELDLLTVFPWVEWRKPVTIETAQGRWLCCRVCIAMHGLHEEDVPERGFETHESFRAHFEEHHPDACV